jgi:hypothetical protein
MLLLACKTDSARRTEIEACSERSADPLEIELCLSGNYGWKESDARSAAGTRARQLAVIRQRSEDSAWAANDRLHREHIRACGEQGGDLARCLLLRFGWTEQRAAVAADSVWAADGSQHAREVRDCLGQGQPGALIGPCLQLRHKWPSQRALALDDSLARARLGGRGR